MPRCFLFVCFCLRNYACSSKLIKKVFQPLPLLCCSSIRDAVRSPILKGPTKKSCKQETEWCWSLIHTTSCHQLPWEHLWQPQSSLLFIFVDCVFRIHYLFCWNNVFIPDYIPWFFYFWTVLHPLAETNETLPTNESSSVWDKTRIWDWNTMMFLSYSCFWGKLK